MAAIRSHACAGFRPGAGDLVQAGRRPGQIQGAPHRRAARRVPQHRGQVRQHRDIAHARGPERDRHQHDPPVQHGRLPRLAQRGTEAGGQSCLVRGLAEQDRAGVADQARPACGDLQGMAPPVMLHGEERSSPGDCKVW